MWSDRGTIVSYPRRTAARLGTAWPCGDCSALAAACRASDPGGAAGAEAPCDEVRPAELELSLAPARPSSPSAMSSSWRCRSSTRPAEWRRSRLFRLVGRGTAVRRSTRRKAATPSSSSCATAMRAVQPGQAELQLSVNFETSVGCIGLPYLRLSLRASAALSDRRARRRARRASVATPDCRRPTDRAVAAATGRPRSPTRSLAACERAGRQRRRGWRRALPTCPLRRCELRQRHLVGDVLEDHLHRHADADRRAARRRRGWRSSSAPSASLHHDDGVRHLGGEAGVIDLVHDVEAEDLAARRSPAPTRPRVDRQSEQISRAGKRCVPQLRAALHDELVALGRGEERRACSGVMAGIGFL